MKIVKVNFEKICNMSLCLWQQKTTSSYKKSRDIEKIFEKQTDFIPKLLFLGSENLKTDVFTKNSTLISCKHHITFSILRIY